MRRIHIPPTIALNIQDKPWTFAACIEYVVDSSPRFNTSGPGIRQGARIVAQFENKLPGALSEVQMRDEDWTALAAEMEAPAAGYYPQLYRLKQDQSLGEPIVVPGRLVLSYLDAVAQAELVGET